MRRILTILFLLIYSVLFGQDIKPISPNFKALQSPSFSYFTTDSSVWIYKGSLYGWTKLAKYSDLSNKYVPYTGATKTVNLGKQKISASSLILNKDSIPQILQEGQVYWDSITQSVVVNTEDPDVHLNVGEELWVPICYNSSGVNILNGNPVYISGSTNGYPTITLASNISYTESRLIGVATEDIPNGSYGRVTRFGYVNDINLSACSPGDNVYLGDKVLTHIRPTGGNFPVVIGKAITCSLYGKLLVYPQSVEYSAEVNQSYGWPSYLQGEQTTLSFTNATRTFTITPVLSTFYFYQAGVKYIKTGTQSFQITDVEGIHFLYYDQGVIYDQVNPSRDQALNIIRNSVTISAIYWDADNDVAIYNSNERHTFYWPSWVHAYAHLSFGTQYSYGLGLTNITLGLGTTNADAQFGVDSGAISDEDITSTTDVVASTAGLPIYYRTGANGLWRRITRSGYSFLNDGTTGLAMYNLYSGGAWSIVSMTNNYYRLVHVFATNDIGLNKTIVMSGVAQYASAAAAEAGVNAEIANIYNSNLPFAEVKHIGSLILHTKTGLGNSVNARYVATVSGGSWLDFRKSSVIPTASSGGSGASSFLSLSDTPDSYAGHANKLVGVDSGETGVEFKPVTVDNNGNITSTIAGGSKVILANSKNSVAVGSVEVGNDAELVFYTQSSNERARIKQDGSAQFNSTVSSTKYLINGSDLVTQQIRNGYTTTVPSEDAIYDKISELRNNSRMGSANIAGTETTVTFPTSFSNINYYLKLDAWYDKTIDGKTVKISNAIYNFSKSTTGFSFSVDTIAGSYQYLAVDSVSLSTTMPNNTLLWDDVVTSIGNPGADNKIPSEKAVRAALAAGLTTYPSAGIVRSTGSAWDTSLTDNSSNWNTAYSDRFKWDGGATGLTASTGRVSLGATTLGENLFTISNPSAVTFPRFNADNTVSALSATDFKTALGIETNLLDLVKSSDGGWSSNGSSTMQGWGSLSGFTTSGTLTSEVSGYGAAVITTTTSTSGNDAYLASNSAIFYTEGLPIFYGYFYCNSANQDFFIGLNSSRTNGYSTSFYMIGLKFDSSDTNMFFCVGNGTNTTLVDTGVSKSTGAPKKIAVEVVSTTSVKMYLYNYDNALLASTTITTNIPTNQPMYYTVTVETQTTATKSAKIYSSKIITR